jgi:hypothetical protein
VITLDYTSYSDPILGQASTYEQDYIRNDDLYTQRVEGRCYQSSLVAVGQTENKEGAICVKVGEILYKHEGYLYGKPQK